MLHGSVSAPVLTAARELQGYAHSKRVARKVPPLALVPLDQLQQLQRRQEKGAEDEQLWDKQVRRRRQRKANDNTAGGEREGRQEQQKRLGERFLGMMALLARLKRMDLDEASSPTGKAERKQLARRSPLPSSRSVIPTATEVAVISSAKEEQKLSAYELLVQKKKAQRSRSAAAALATTASVGATAIQLSPHRRPEPVVNVATAPLREHLTFEISMLLPQPIDARQSALESPIRRKKRRRRLRRKKRRLGATIVDGKRTWSTSHATWVPHASADYAKARSQEAVAAQASSKLVAKFAALKHSSSGSTLRGGGRGDEQQRKYLYATDGGRRRRSSGGLEQEALPAEEEDCQSRVEEVEGGLSSRESLSGEDSGDSEEDEEEEEEDALPELLHPVASATTLAQGLPSERRPLRQPATVSVIRPVQTHQAAWISPELRRWLVSSGLFRTTNTSSS